MEFLPFPFASAIVGAFLAFLCIILFLNVFGLPANWIILGLVALWKLLNPLADNLGVFFWAIMIGLAVLGEVLETGLQVLKARKYGSSSSGTFVGMIGAIIGAILMAPLFWGIGAFFGALIGAWIGCFGMELLKGRSSEEALTSAFGTLLGRLLGSICKIGIGGAMIVVTWRAIWPAQPESPAAPLGETVLSMLQIAA